MISKHRVFTMDEASQVLPVVRKITLQYATRVDAMLHRLESINLNNNELILQIEAEANELIDQWHSKIEKLGAKPKGLWYVDFDFGQGCYCWKFPEPDLFYWHAYDDGFSGRRMIDQSQPAPFDSRENGHGKENKNFKWVEDRSSSDQFSPWRF